MSDGYLFDANSIIALVIKRRVNLLVGALTLLMISQQNFSIFWTMFSWSVGVIELHIGRARRFL